MTTDAATQERLESAGRWNLRGLGVAAFAHGASDLYSGMVPFLIFATVTGRGFSPAYQGAIGFLWYLTSSITQPLFGAYADTRGRWWFLPFSVSLTVAGVSCAGLAGGLGTLAGLIVLGGLGSGMMHPEAGKYAAMLSGPRRSGGISIFQIGGQIGFAFGPLAAAALVQAQGTRGSLWMLIPGACAVAFLLAVMPGVDGAAQRLHDSATKELGSRNGGVDRLGVMLLVAGTALEYIVGASFLTYLPNLITARGGGVTFAGEIVTAFLIASVLGLYLGGYLGDRVGPLAVSVLALLLAVPCLYGFLVLGGRGSIPLLLAANALLNIQTAPAVALVQRMLPRNLGMALGLINGVAFGIGSVLVTLVGYAVARIGADAALMRVSGLPILGAFVFALVGLRQRRMASLRRQRV
ncbi:MAG TPA: MFS transporter [Acetobacteraceae bacterium]|nr:MFS transporter [Acetobacteraceae bacterium]